MVRPEFEEAALGVLGEGAEAHSIASK